MTIACTVSAIDVRQVRTLISKKLDGDSVISAALDEANKDMDASLTDGKPMRGAVGKVVDQFKHHLSEQTEAIMDDRVLLATDISNPDVANPTPAPSKAFNGKCSHMFSGAEAEQYVAILEIRRHSEIQLFNINDQNTPQTVFLDYGRGLSSTAAIDSRSFMTANTHLLNLQKLFEYLRRNLALAGCVPGVSEAETSANAEDFVNKVQVLAIGYGDMALWLQSSSNPTRTNWFWDKMTKADASIRAPNLFLGFAAQGRWSAFYSFIAAQKFLDEAAKRYPREVNYNSYDTVFFDVGESSMEVVIRVQGQQLDLNTDVIKDRLIGPNLAFVEASSKIGAQGPFNHQKLKLYARSFLGSGYAALLTKTTFRALKRVQPLACVRSNTRLYRPDFSVYTDSKGKPATVRGCFLSDQAGMKTKDGRVKFPGFVHYDGGTCLLMKKTLNRLKPASMAEKNDTAFYEYWPTSPNAIRCMSAIRAAQNSEDLQNPPRLLSAQFEALRTVLSAAGANDRIVIWNDPVTFNAWFYDGLVSDEDRKAKVFQSENQMDVNGVFWSRRLRHQDIHDAIQNACNPKTPNTMTAVNEADFKFSHIGCLALNNLYTVLFHQTALNPANTRIVLTGFKQRGINRNFGLATYYANLRNQYAEAVERKGCLEAAALVRPNSDQIDREDLTFEPVCTVSLPNWVNAESPPQPYAPGQVPQQQFFGPGGVSLPVSPMQPNTMLGAGYGQPPGMMGHMGGQMGWQQQQMMGTPMGMPMNGMNGGMAGGFNGAAGQNMMQGPGMYGQPNVVQNGNQIVSRAPINFQPY